MYMAPLFGSFQHLRGLLLKPAAQLLQSSKLTLQIIIRFQWSGTTSSQRSSSEWLMQQALPVADFCFLRTCWGSPTGQHKIRILLCGRQVSRQRRQSLSHGGDIGRTHSRLADAHCDRLQKQNCWLEGIQSPLAGAGSRMWLARGAKPGSLSLLHAVKLPATTSRNI